MADPTGPRQPSFGRWMGSMWLFTVLRFGLFAALWAILWACGVELLLAGMIGALASVPLSYLLLARPRNAFTAQLEARVTARQHARQRLDHELDPDAPDTD